MESLVERLFRETYELDEIPDLRGDTPSPLRPSELLSLSSPLVEIVHESGGDPELLDRDLYAQLQHTPHEYFSGIPVATTPNSSPHNSDLDRPQASQDTTNLGGCDPVRGTHRVTFEYSH